MFVRIPALVMMMMTSIVSSAAVNWQLQVGGMMMNQYGSESDQENFYSLLEKKSHIEWKAGILIQIPLSSNIPLFIESGLSFRSKNVISQKDGFHFHPTDISEEDYYNMMSYQGYSLELPVKAGWKLKLNESNAFDFAAGPYVSMMTERGEGDPLSVGANISAAFRHRCMSFGVEWQNPIFLNGPRNYYGNSFLLTIGINFKGRNINLDKLADSLEMAGNILSTANAAMGYGDADGYSSTSSFIESSNNETSSKSRVKSSDKSKNGNGFSLSEQTAFNADRNTYFKWESFLINGKNISKKEGKHACEEMRKLRTKWEKRGKSWTKSNWEDTF